MAASTAILVPGGTDARGLAMARRERTGELRFVHTSEQLLSLVSNECFKKHSKKCWKPAKLQVHLFRDSARRIVDRARIVHHARHVDVVDVEVVHVIMVLLCVCFTRKA